MIIARSATLPTLLSLSLYAAFSPSSFGARPALAAPSIPALTFNVTARVGTTGQYAGPQQTVKARVLLRGKTARIESTTGGTPAVVLYSPPYVYRLLPNSKAGVRWKIDKNQSSNLADFDPQALLRDPAKLKAEIIKGGAKRVGTGVINKAPVEIFEARNFGGKGQRVRVWLRKSDSLPLRLEGSGGQFQITASWRDYFKPKSLPAALFAPPSGFHVRELKGPPSFSSL